jgi:hypothetical protein
VTVLLAAFVACSGTQIAKDRWIPLTAGAPVQGSQRSVDGSVEYVYVFNPGGTEKSGRIDIRGKVIPAAKLESLDVYVNFLDGRGKRLDVKSIYSSGTGRGTPKRSFSQTFDIPQGARSIAFSFSGRQQRDLF